MRAIVLVGGQATRMRPLSRRTPKPLMPVLHRPLLAWLLEGLRDHGVADVTLAMLAGNDAIRSCLGDGAALGIRIGYSIEHEPLGSGGAIAQAAAGWREPFFVCNGDLVTDVDYAAMAAEHRARGAELSIALHEVEDPSPFGVVALDGESRITRFVEKPSREEAPSRLINAGTWLFEPSLLEEMDATRFHRVEEELFPRLAERGRAIFGHHAPGYWQDVGRPETLLRVNLDMAPRGGAVHDAAEVAPGARVEAPCVIGAGSRVRDGATVATSLLWDDVEVGAGSVVRDSILATGVRVGADATVVRAVAAHGATIRDGARVEDAAIEPDATVERS